MDLRHVYYISVHMEIFQLSTKDQEECSISLYDQPLIRNVLFKVSS